MPTPFQLLRGDRNPDRPGRYRRLIDLRRTGPGRSSGWVEDDFHHFGVTLEHAAGIMTSASAVAKRAPWSTCSAAAIALRALEGQPLRGRASDIGQLINMRLQCTHMFDLAGLVMAHAFHDRESRTYQVLVPDRAPSFKGGRAAPLGGARAVLSVDGRPGMEWELAGEMIVGPAPYGGRSLNEGFRAWTEAMPEDEAEQAFVLRRAIMVSSGRFVDLDRVETAAEAPLPPVCHTFRGDLTQARRLRGTTRDYSESPEGMLAFRDEVP